MNAIAFDTLGLARRLREGGFSKTQADSVADALRESFSSGDLATRSDMSSLRAGVTTEIAALRAEISDVKAEIIKWMFGAMLAQAALVVTLVKLIPGK